jgi:tRNA(Arg) A34 adenosine deaminase TadA
MKRVLLPLASVALFLTAIGARAENPAPLPDDPACTPQDRVFMELAYAAARKAVDQGSRPFGAVLVKDGKVIAEFSNCEMTTGDVTKHAETGLISAFSPQIDHATFAAATLYTSSEPCTMCCGAIRFAGIGKVVYGVTETQFLRVIGVPVGEHPLESKEVLARTAPQVKVLGPLMEAEGLETHENYWPAHPVSPDRLRPKSETDTNPSASAPSSAHPA